MKLIFKQKITSKMLVKKILLFVNDLETNVQGIYNNKNVYVVQFGTNASAKKKKK